jgi:3-hydroxyisobutyrate dehydrogenase-like beta-hydroxyacid dehydrogenase
VAVNAVGLLSPGEMGKAVAQTLIAHGMPVVSCLEGRSERTRQRALDVGIDIVASYEELVSRTDLVMSILVPAEAHAAASTVAQALVDQDAANLLFVDCNALAPATVCSIGETMRAAGARFVDAGIIGPPPTREGTTRFYASGADAAEFAALAEYGLDVRVIGATVGQASNFKMCYAASTKGRFAIFIELLVAARCAGLYDELMDELRLSQPGVLADMERSLPAIPSKSARWVGEMEEIAATFGDVGMTTDLFAGVADMYRLVTTNSSPSHTDDLETFISSLAEKIERPSGRNRS